MSEVIAVDATHDGCKSKQMKCVPNERDDGRNVIFVSNDEGDK